MIFLTELNYAVVIVQSKKQSKPSRKLFSLLTNEAKEKERAELEFQIADIEKEIEVVKG